MALLQPKLNLRLSQKQILTPGLVQMVSVLALNKLELTDMINAELTENPVLEELDDSVPLLDEVSAREEKMDRESSPVVEEQAAITSQEKDPFEEIDFGSFFSEYLDPGLRTSIEMEESEKPSFENFLSKPTTLTDHLMWQLGSLHVNEDVYRAAELVIGNLNEEGYLTASDDELLGLADEEQSVSARTAGGGGYCFRSGHPESRGGGCGSRGGWRRTWDGRFHGCGSGAGIRGEAMMPRLRSPIRESLAPAWCRPAPCRLAFLSAATPCARPLTWYARWTRSAWARATCANACWPNCTI